MKKVYICSPCRGDYENNIQRAKEYSRAAVEKGVIPVTPHIYLTQFMDDNVPEERELALRSAASWCSAAPSCGPSALTTPLPA